MKTWTGNKRKGGNWRIGYVGFLNYKPHVEQMEGGRTIQVYVSEAAARRAYADVRKVLLVFDAEDKAHV